MNKVVFVLCFIIILFNLFLFILNYIDANRQPVIQHNNYRPLTEYQKSILKQLDTSRCTTFYIGGWTYEEKAGKSHLINGNYFIGDKF